MKTIILSLLFGLSTVLFSQEYRPLLLPDNQWIASSFMYAPETGDFEYKDHHYRFNNVSHEINGKNYLELEVRTRHRIESTPITSWTDWSTAEFYLSEDVEEKKVYVYYTTSIYPPPGEFLLYDFNLEIGDTMDFGGFYDESFGSESGVVTDITYENVFGIENVKVYHFAELEYYSFQLYEGIGTSHGLYTLSFTKDAGWQMTDFGTNLNADEITLKKSNVYPNPFTNQIQIESQKPILNLQLFDMSGKIILSKPSVSELNSGLTSLPRGIYHLRISFKDKTRETLKLIKK